MPRHCSHYRLFFSHAEKHGTEKTLLFLLLTVLVVLFIDRFTNILELLLQETQYKNVVSDWKGFEDNGTNLLRVLVYAVPTLLSLIGLRFIRAENDHSSTFASTCPLYRPAFTSSQRSQAAFLSGGCPYTFHFITTFCCHGSCTTCFQNAPCAF